jgi:membrane protease YdiL (CAAX protease family)
MQQQTRLKGREPRARSSTTLALAWAVTLVLSSLTEIALVELGLRRGWVVTAWLVMSGVLFAMSAWWRPVRPLRGYIIVMTAVVVITYVLRPTLTDLLSMPASADLTVAYVSRSVFAGLAVGLALLVTRILGLSKRDAYLEAGDWSAESKIGLPGGRRTSWSLLGPLAILVFGGIYALATISEWEAGMRIDLATISLAAGLALLNSFAEEVTFRSGPLGSLTDVVTARQAIWMTSAWFGLAHYFDGTPGGWSGVASTGVLALVLGYAMVRTRGLGWPWVIHFALDLIVFIALLGAL